MANRPPLDALSPLLLGAFWSILRLCGAIDWPWFWVLSPWWIPLLWMGVVELSDWTCRKWGN